MKENDIDINYKVPLEQNLKAKLDLIQAFMSQEAVDYSDSIEFTKDLNIYNCVSGITDSLRCQQDTSEFFNQH